jgi:hypothetical protein
MDGWARVGDWFKPLQGEKVDHKDWSERFVRTQTESGARPWRQAGPSEHALDVPFAATLQPFSVKRRQHS